VKTPALILGFISTLLILIPYTQSSVSQTTVPDGWRRVEAEGKLAFYLPPGMKQSTVHGLENLYQEYKSATLTLSFVYEPDSVLAYEERESEYGKDHREIATEVDGRKAILFIYRREIEDNHPPTYNADIYVGDLPGARVKLWMWASGKSPDDIETARRIFSSVEFTKDKRSPD
jgi:hypothetical protein